MITIYTIHEILRRKIEKKLQRMNSKRNSVLKSETKIYLT